MSKEIEEIILKGKIEEVKDKTLHKNWMAWYDRRKNITGSNKVYSKIMLNGLVKDFYSVNDYLQSKITELEQENERIKLALFETDKILADFHFRDVEPAPFPTRSQLDANRDLLLTNNTNK